MLEDQKHTFVLEVPCKCECGTKRSVRASALKGGRTKSCGCFRKEVSGANATSRRKHHINPGDRYGRLVVLNSDNYLKVQVKCDCGTTKTVTASGLYQGSTRSCGCLKHEMTVALGKANGVRNRHSSHTLYNTWVRVTSSDIPYHQPWHGNVEQFIKDVESEIGERPFGLWLVRKDPNLAFAPGNLAWAKRTVHNPNRVTLTDEQRKEIVRLVRQGQSQKSVAQKYGVSKSLVNTISRNPKFQ